MQEQMATVELNLPRHFVEFGTALQAASHAEDAWRALQDLTASAVGFRLFTVMTVDLANGLARRAFTSHPSQYPVSGTKPIGRDGWFDIVHGKQQLFVANTISGIARVFPDHEEIRSMGCGSVVNLPVVIGGMLTATINMLHREHYYGPERVDVVARQLTEPAQRAFIAADALI